VRKFIIKEPRELNKPHKKKCLQTFVNLTRQCAKRIANGSLVVRRADARSSLPNRLKPSNNDIKHIKKNRVTPKKQKMTK
jgi:hypothetical protein